MKPKLTRAETIARNKLDKYIQEVVSRDLTGIPINIMDIHYVFEAAYAADQHSRDLGLGDVERLELVRGTVIAKYKEKAQS